MPQDSDHHHHHHHHHHHPGDTYLHQQHNSPPPSYHHHHNHLDTLPQTFDHQRRPHGQVYDHLRQAFAPSRYDGDDNARHQQHNRLQYGERGYNDDDDSLKPGYGEDHPRHHHSQDTTEEQSECGPSRSSPAVPRDSQEEKESESKGDNSVHEPATIPKEFKDTSSPASVNTGARDHPRRSDSRPRSEPGTPDSKPYPADDVPPSEPSQSSRWGSNPGEGSSSPVGDRGVPSTYGGQGSGVPTSSSSGLQPPPPPPPPPPSAMVMSTAAKGEEGRKNSQRYSINSYASSPDPDSMDKTDENDDDDSEFSDGGHYKNPPGPYPPPPQQPPPPRNPAYPPDAGYEGRQSPSPDTDKGVDSIDMRKRRFFQQCLENGGPISGGRYPMEYPLQTYPPQKQDYYKGPATPTRDGYPARGKDGRQPSPNSSLQPSQPFPAEGAGAGSVPGPLAEQFQQYMRRFLDQSCSPDHMKRMHDPSTRGPRDPDLRKGEREGDAQPLKKDPSTPQPPDRGSFPQDNPGFPPNFSPSGRAHHSSFSPGKDAGYPPYPSRDHHHHQRGGPPPAYSPDREKPVKREYLTPYGSPEDSPAKGVPPPPPPPPPHHHHPSPSPSSSSSACSSTLTKIPIGVSPFYQGDMPPLHEMMLGGGLGGPGVPHLPGMGGIGSGVAKEGAPPGHVYFCHLCSYSGATKPEFDAHMTIHFEYNCEFCDYTSRTEGRLKRHIKDFHSSDSQTRTVPGRPKVFRCKQCEYSTVDKLEFWRHARVHIKEDKMLECPQCPFVTEYKHHLEYHLRNHFGCKPYKCEKCNYSCVNKSMLNSHMKSHTNVYQYRCADCTYATKYCHSLKLHLRKYNHKPATVLNSDGSLPQGIDAEISGLSLLAKRGPPRGPRGLRKEKDGVGEGGFMPPGFFPMTPSPHSPHGAMTPMTPLLAGGMIPGRYWPMMGGSPMQPPPPPPPPLLSMGGMMGGPAQGMEGQGQGHRAEPEGRGGGGGGWLSCRLCKFSTDSQEELQDHVFKVHASENRDLMGMLPYGVTDPTESDVHRMQARRMSAPSASQSSPEAAPGPELYPRRNTFSSPQKPRAEMEEMGVWGRKRELFPEHRYGEGLFMAPGGGGREREVEDLRREGPKVHEGADILREMTLKFGNSGLSQASVPEAAMALAASIAATATTTTTAAAAASAAITGADNGALDLSNKTTSSPPQGEPEPPSPSSSRSPAQPEPPLLPAPAAGEKRAHADCSAHSAEDNTYVADDIQPRKRSRKGKAFKLDTIYLRRLEQQQQQEQQEKQMREQGPGTEEETETRNPQSREGEEPPTLTKEEEKGSQGLDEEEDRFSQLQKDIQLLNSDQATSEPPQEPDEQTAPENQSQAPESQDQNQPDPERQDESQDRSPRPEADPDAPNPRSPPPLVLAEGSVGESGGEGEEEEDMEKEREKLLKTIYKSRHQPLRPSMRRGTELALKILHDSNAGLDLPPPPLDLPPPSSSSSHQPPPPTSPRTGNGRCVSPPTPGGRHPFPPPTTTSSSSSSSSSSPPSGPPPPPLPLLNGPTSRRALTGLDPTMSPPPPPAAAMMDISPERHSAYVQTQPPLPAPAPAPGPDPRMRMFPSVPPMVSAMKMHPYECKLCELAFGDATMYYMHMAFHSDLRHPFRCKDCGYHSKDKVEFYSHMITKPHGHGE